MISSALCLALVLGALGRRLGGGLLASWVGHTTGDLPGRAAWGLLASLPALLVFPWWVALLCGFGLPLGAILRGNSPGMGLTGWADAGWLALHGLAMALIPALVLFFTGHAWLPVVAAGLLCPLAYRVAYWDPLEFPPLGCLERDPPPTAELLIGGWLAAGIVAGAWG